MCPGGSTATAGTKKYYLGSGTAKWRSADNLCPEGTELASFQSNGEWSELLDLVDIESKWVGRCKNNFKE